jgi:hypothetical protein
MVVLSNSVALVPGRETVRRGLRSANTAAAWPARYGKCSEPGN